MAPQTNFDQRCNSLRTTAVARVLFARVSPTFAARRLDDPALGPGGPSVFDHATVSSEVCDAVERMSKNEICPCPGPFLFVCINLSQSYNMLKTEL